MHAVRISIKPVAQISDTAAGSEDLRMLRKKSPFGRARVGCSANTNVGFGRARVGCSANTNVGTPMTKNSIINIFLVSNG